MFVNVFPYFHNRLQTSHRKAQHFRHRTQPRFCQLCKYIVIIIFYTHVWKCVFVCNVVSVYVFNISMTTPPPPARGRRPVVEDDDDDDDGAHLVRVCPHLVTSHIIYLHDDVVVSYTYYNIHTYYYIILSLYEYVCVCKSYTGRRGSAHPVRAGVCPEALTRHVRSGPGARAPVIRQSKAVHSQPFSNRTDKCISNRVTGRGRRTRLSSCIAAARKRD